MHGPTPRDLIDGLQDAINTEVYPTIREENAQRQLKAAIRVLQRLSRSWLTYGQWDDKDTTDYRRVLRKIGEDVRGIALPGDERLSRLEEIVYTSSSLFELQDVSVALERGLRAESTLLESERQRHLTSLRRLHLSTTGRALAATGLK